MLSEVIPGSNTNTPRMGEETKNSKKTHHPKSLLKNKTFRRRLESDLQKRTSSPRSGVSPTVAMSVFKSSNNASKGSSRQES